VVLSGCSADAARTDIFLVAEHMDALCVTAERMRAGGYRTAVFGNFAGDPRADGFDHHCTWQSASPPRPFGPTVVIDGQTTTFPDEVGLAKLIVDCVRRLAIADERPLFACWLVHPEVLAWRDAAAILRAECHRLSLQGRAPLLIAAGSSKANGRPFEVLASRCGGAFTERTAAAADIAATVLGLAGLPGDFRGRSFSDSLPNH
ncbi:MAG: hypothetical protein KDC98_12240, partial [Planctomycetes bacterium]|nr:hypothetical protein [Planctomycetota bacterium]